MSLPAQKVKSAIPAYDIELKVGDGESFILTVTSGGAPIAGGIGNWKFWYTAKASITDAYADAVIAKDNDLVGGMVILDEEDCTVRLDFTSADREALAGQGKLVHDAQGQAVGGEPHTLFEGLLLPSPDVTDVSL